MHLFGGISRRSRALLRLARQRRLLALTIATACATAFASVGGASIVLHHHPLPELHVTAVTPPLAPAPPAPASFAADVQRYVPAALSHMHMHPLSGLASWYGAMWRGKPTASGEIYDEHLMTASHKTLPFGTLVRVTDLASRRSVVVKINDRGTLRPNRVIDLSEEAATRLGIVEEGLAHVKLEVVGHS